MLINTVLLFIKDVLPVFVLLSFVRTLLAPACFTQRNLLLAPFLTLLGIIIMYSFIAELSELFDGDGVEILLVVINLLVYASLLVTSSFLVSGRALSPTQNHIVLIGVVLLSVSHLSDFFLYFSMLVNSQQSMLNTLVGTAFGLGICLSFSVLFTMFLTVFVRPRRYLQHTFWSLYLAGLLTNKLHHLQQMDMLSNSPSLWDTSRIIDDASEYGSLFNNLFGYVASPNIEFVSTYLMSIALYLLMVVIVKKQINTVQEVA